MPNTAVAPAGEPLLEKRTSEALQAWKEIAAYMKCGIRTVQRWERSAGLPVRRIRPGDNKSPVLAFRAELDRWLYSRSTSAP